MRHKSSVLIADRKWGRYRLSIIEWLSANSSCCKKKRKSKTGLIVGIVAAVIILIVAIGIFIAGNSKKETLSFNLSVMIQELIFMLLCLTARGR